LAQASVLGSASPDERASQDGNHQQRESNYGKGVQRRRFGYQGDSSNDDQYPDEYFGRITHKKVPPERTKSF
jgi:hypothetical protein